MMQKQKWEFWTEHPDLSALNVDRHLKQIFLEVAKKSLPPIQGQLKLIDHEKEIVPGIEVVATPGHTPGHIALAISSGGEQLLSISDAPIHPIHLEQPDWYAAFDLNSEQIATTRRRLFDRASTERAFVFAFHFPSPGLGYIIQKEDAWHWQPIGTRNYKIKGWALTRLAIKTWSPYHRGSLYPCQVYQ